MTTKKKLSFQEWKGLSDFLDLESYSELTKNKIRRSKSYSYLELVRVLREKN